MTYNILLRMNYSQIARMRQYSRNNDIYESEQLLLELGTLEPVVQQCFKIIEATCLSQGIYCQVEGGDVPDNFQDFIDEHYMAFARAAIRAMYLYGFVPWRVRPLKNNGMGDHVPEVLPPGTFTWEVSTTRPENQVQRDTRLVTFNIHPTVPGITAKDANIFYTSYPAYNISQNSIIHATVHSPLSHILIDYKNLRDAQKRRANADAWQVGFFHSLGLLCFLTLRLQEHDSADRQYI
jgi:hypothetical protein